jgi:hypothetical protein
VGLAHQVISVLKVVLNRPPVLKECLVKVSIIKISLTVCLVQLDCTVLSLVSQLLLDFVEMATIALQMKTRYHLLLSHMHVLQVIFVQQAHLHLSNALVGNINQIQHRLTAFCVPLAISVTILPVLQYLI